MKYKIFILLGLFLFGIAGASPAKVTFNVGTCSFEEGAIGLYKDSCSIDGKYYCDTNGIPYITANPGLGCSMGKNTYDSRTDSICCPPTDFCNETASGIFQCQQREERCADQLTESACTAPTLGCIWLENTLTCVNTIGDLDCGYYDNQTQCLVDEYDIARRGIGLGPIGNFIECNDQTFSVLAENSSCKWVGTAPAGKECQLNYVAVQSTNSDVSFSCSNVYVLGKCEDGKQSVSWTSENSSLGFGAEGVPEECLRALNCAGGEEERFCGEPPIKLSGFSLFALLASLSIIGIFYFVKNATKKK